MVAESKPLLKVGEESLFPASKPSPSTNEISPSSLTIDDQINFYRAMLVADATRRAQSVWQRDAKNQAYQAEAQQEYSVGDTTVNIFAPFDPASSALQTFTLGQRIVTVAVLIILLALFIMNAAAVSVAILAIIMVFYFGNLLLTFWLSARTLEHSEEVQIADEVVHALADVAWPRYTILCPLYRETEVVEQFATAMGALDYPTDKLQILFLTEEDDEETRDAIRAANLPPHFQIVTVPDGKPRTKPRACNYGLLQATGDFLVIFDAEDVPDPLQLKKAVLTFLSHDAELGCVQAKLNFYNSDQNILTRLFTIEYSAWFEMTLPGLQQGRFSIPLGGTSNHFRVSTLQEVGAWDAYNVTEDCDLGLRLTTNNYRTVVLDSTTYEEANPSVSNWIRQRSRWIKGYFQTYLVHMRNPRRYLKRARLSEFLSLQLIVGGRTIVLLINPLMWLLLIIYALFRAQVSSLYETLFPASVLYMAVISMLIGNLLYVYIHFTGCIKRGQYGLVKWGLLLPFYWVLGSTAALKALRQLIFNPHHWEKTKHGLHLNQQGARTNNDPVEQPHVSQSGHSAAPSPVAPVASLPANSPSPDGAGEVYASFPGATDSAAYVLAREISVRETFWRRLYTWMLEDKWFTATILVACVASVVATAYFFQNHYILLYKDASSHLGISRLIFDNVKPGLAQLGGVWLPLPHLLMMPFTAVDYFWTTGLAGAFVSMPCYLIAAVYIFLSARRLSGNSFASFVGSLVFILNPNVLYLQATPLTEPLAAATTTVACYYFVVWMKDSKPTALILMAIATFLATLSRYDGWALFMAFLILVPFVSILKRQERRLIESNVIVFAILGAFGIFIWILWNALIFGDPLYFQRSEYSSQALHQMLYAQHKLYTYLNVSASIRFFVGLSTATLGLGLFVLSCLGALIHIARRRFSLDTIAILVFLIPVGFYVFSSYTGQVTILLPELIADGQPNEYFNARFGMIVVPPAAIFLALLVSSISSLVSRWNLQLPKIGRPPIAVIFTGFIIIESVAIAQTRIVALVDGEMGWSCAPPAQEIVHYLAQYYDGGRILIDPSAVDGWDIALLADVHLKNYIYQGSGALWQKALDNPSSSVNWIIFNPYADDLVAKRVGLDNLKFRVDFHLVAKETNGRSLYRRNALPDPSERPLQPKILADKRQCYGN